MNERALEELSNNLARALDRLAEALDVPEDDPLAVDGTIQRFEFTFELFWKTIQRLLAREGVEARSPKSTLREACRLGWLADEQAWLDLLEDRDLTSHTYREAHALEIYRRIPSHCAAMRGAFEGLRKRQA
jgi:nucleotidyltransferase substrate binding protein (TIGR01987 family)